METPETPEFTTLETFTITGRGTVHVVAVSDEDLNNREPRTLVEKFVLLDGELRKVRGVETPCIHWRPGSEAFRNLGLFLGPPVQAPLP